MTSRDRDEVLRLAAMAKAARTRACRVKNALRDEVAALRVERAHHELARIAADLHQLLLEPTE